MARYSNSVTTSLSATQAERVVSAYLHGRGFHQVNERGEQVWRKRDGMAYASWFMRFEASDGSVYIEAWMPLASVTPSSYSGEDDPMSGVLWHLAAKIPFRQVIRGLERLLTETSVVGPVESRLPPTEIEAVRARALRVHEQLRDQLYAGAIDQDEYDTKAARVNSKLAADCAAITDRMGTSAPAGDQSAGGPGAPLPSRHLGLLHWMSDESLVNANVWSDGTRIWCDGNHPVDWRFLRAQDDAGQMDWADPESKRWFNMELLPYLAAHEARHTATAQRGPQQAHRASRAETDRRDTRNGCLVMFAIGLLLILCSCGYLWNVAGFSQLFGYY